MVQIQEGRRLISPDFARDILATAKYEHQRKLYRHQVVILTDKIARKQWVPGSQIAFALLDGNLLLLNGQHRLHAVIESGEALEFQILILPAETMEDVGQLYARFNVNERKRSVSELMDGRNIYDTCEVERRTAVALYQAVGLIANNFKPLNYIQTPVLAQNADYRLELCEPWWDRARQYEHLIAPAPRDIKQRLLIGGRMAVALVTLEHQEAKAIEFWSGVASDDGLGRDDPRKLFLRDIYNRDLRRQGASESAHSAAVAWNAWFSGADLKLIKVVTGAVFKLLGTPWAGGKQVTSAPDQTADAPLMAPPPKARLMTGR
jgi:hypothetical protein